MYALADCNNFFASCERVFNPSLDGKPIVVLSANDGCIIARSNEAKALGIKMGEPFFKARDTINRHKVAYFSSNFVLYGDMSRRVMSIIKSFVPSTEIYSVDEAFMDLSGIDQSTLAEFGRTISSTIKQSTGIPVSIGIAPTKTLAKIASKLCKQYPKLRNCCFVHRPQDIEKVLRTYPIEDVWGIGRRLTKMLRAAGITTAYEFTQTPPEWVRAKMSVTGLRTWQELRGTPCIEFEDTPPNKQQICVSRSFSRDVTDREVLHKAIASFATNAAAKLRAQRSCAQMVQVFILTNRHRPDLPQLSQSHIVTLRVATDSTLEIVKAATDALNTVFTEGYGYKRAGIILMGVGSNSGIQSELFDTTDRSKHSRLMHTLDMLNHHMGRGTLVTAAEGFGTRFSLSDHRSPHYTTDLDQIIKIKTDK